MEGKEQGRKRSSDSKERSSSRVSYIIHCMASHYPKNSVACGIKYRVTRQVALHKVDEN